MPGEARSIEPGSEVTPAGLRDLPSVTADGRPRAQLEGVASCRGKLHVDQRGQLMELVNFSDPFWEEPVVHAYAITVAPGHVKGWGMHRVQADRYVAISGLLRVVLYDGRRESPSFQRFAEFWFSDEVPGFLRIPPGVWHADQNAGSEPCRVLNFPTHAYDPDAPDKYRIDPASGEIPFDFTLRDG